MSIASRIAAQNKSGGRSVTQSGRGSDTYKENKSSRTRTSSNRQTTAVPKPETVSSKRESPLSNGMAVKPTGIPRYYTLRGIQPDPNHDWYYDSSQNVWVWTMSEREKDLTKVTEDEYNSQFVQSSTIDKNTIRFRGNVFEVFGDEHGSYIEDADTGITHYLRSDWWHHPEMRADADKAIIYSKDPIKTKDSSWWDNLKLPSVGLPSLPDMPENVDVDFPDLNINTPKGGIGGALGDMLGIPKISNSMTAIGTVLLLFGGLIVLLFAVGYSGVAGSSSVRRKR